MCCACMCVSVCLWMDMCVILTNAVSPVSFSLSLSAQPHSQLEDGSEKIISGEEVQVRLDNGEYR
jgi:hypothetical protein